MSHAATNWAIQQKGLKPLTKLLLWHIADAHNPAFGCFPSQKRLADEMEVSRSTVNQHLDLLEEARLILRERTVDAATNRQLPTRYFLAFEAEFFEKSRVRNPDTEPPLNPNDGAESRVRNPDTDPVSENGGSRVRNSGKAVSGLSDTEPVSEPVIIEPVMRARGDAAPDGASPPGAEGARGDSAARADASAPAAAAQGAPEHRPAPTGRSKAERDRFWRQRFIIDWLKGERPGAMVLRAIGIDAARLSDADIEAQALAMRGTYLKAVAGFVRWAEACNAGDASQRTPIPTVRELMECLADPAKRPLMERQLAILAQKDAELRLLPDEDDDDDRSAA